MTNLAELDIVGLKIQEGADTDWGITAEVVGTVEDPLLRVLWVGEHFPRSFGRYFFAGVDYPLYTDDPPPDGDRDFPVVYHVDREWLKRGGDADVPLYIYRNINGTFYGSMEIDS
jgi:hypothetical protein